MAMESAAVLNDELTRTDSQQLDRALRNYVQRRQRRVESAQDSSRKMGTMMFVGSTPLAWIRNQLVKIYTLGMFVKSISDLMNEPI